MEKFKTMKRVFGNQAKDKAMKKAKMTKQPHNLRYPIKNAPIPFRLKRVFTWRSERQHYLDTILLYLAHEDLPFRLPTSGDSAFHYASQHSKRVTWVSSLSHSTGADAAHSVCRADT